MTSACNTVSCFNWKGFLKTSRPIGLLRLAFNHSNLFWYCLCKQWKGVISVDKTQAVLSIHTPHTIHVEGCIPLHWQEEQWKYWHKPWQFISRLYVWRKEDCMVVVAKWFIKQKTWKPLILMQPTIVLLYFGVPQYNIWRRVQKILLTLNSISKFKVLVYQPQ